MNQKASQLEDDESNAWKWYAAAAIVVVVPFLWWSSAWAIHALKIGSIGSHGATGDAFAPIAGALSAAALFLLYQSNRSQDKAVALQRAELGLQREALAAQVKELAAQAESLRDQLAKMDSQHLAMQSRNEIATIQVVVDSFRALETARLRAFQMRNGALGGFETLYRAHFHSQGAIPSQDLEEAIDAKDRMAVARFFERYPSPQTSGVLRNSLEAVDAAQTRDFSEEVVQRHGSFATRGAQEP